MKRYWTFTAILITILLTFSLAGCGTANQSAAQDKKDSETATVTASKKQPEKQTDTQEKNNQVQESANAAVTDKSSSTNVSSSTEVNHATKTTTTVQPNTNTNTTQTVTTSVKKTAASASASKSATNTTTGTIAKSQVPAETVTLSITGPNDHPSILEPTKVAYKQDDTVYTVLSREAGLKNIFVGKKGSGATLYIEGLEDNNGKWSFYEFDYGPKSGWIFKINGAELTKSAGISNVKAGDRIECIYIQ